MTSLVLRGIGKRFGGVVAARSVNLTVSKGSRTAIVGPSGSGKTTLLRLIAGFDSPDGGTLTLDGKLLVDGPRIVPAHERIIGFVPQDGALFPHLTVEANIAFGIKGSAAMCAARVDELMDFVALDHAMRRRWPHELSGGQQQRVALARALAHKPTLMLLDEPFSALDTGLRASTCKAVAQLLSNAGITTILVTHDQSEALSFADQLVVMRDGELVQSGSPVDVYWHPRDPMTARFLGDAIILPARVKRGWATCALGRLPTTATPDGAVTIMLRPEQLQLAVTTGGDAHNAGREGSEGSGGNAGNAGNAFGIVSEIAFGGPTCEVTVALQPDAIEDSAPTTQLRLRYPGNQVPAIGAKVRLIVAGEAHVFEGDPAVAQDEYRINPRASTALQP